MVPKLITEKMVLLPVAKLKLAPWNYKENDEIMLTALIENMR